MPTKPGKGECPWPSIGAGIHCAPLGTTGIPGREGGDARLPAPAIQALWR